jgi:hypothetical protein
MFQDAVRQYQRIIDSYVDEDKAQFRLVHLISNDDPSRFSGDKNTMSGIWKAIKVNFKQDAFKDWWEKIHNVTPRPLYGEMASNSFISCICSAR